jgi:hypothetical protein
MALDRHLDPLRRFALELSQLVDQDGRGDGHLAGRERRHDVGQPLGRDVDRIAEVPLQPLFLYVYLFALAQGDGAHRLVVDLQEPRYFKAPKTGR